MDIAILIGILGALGLVIGAMISAGTVAAFLDWPSALIVVGGTFFVVMARHSLETFVAHLAALSRLVAKPQRDVGQLSQTLPEYATRIRRDGPLALEPQLHDIENPLIRTGLTLIVDGADEPRLTQRLQFEMDSVNRRDESIIAAWQTWADVAPAMGMIGTLVGLVQMLGGMSDPGSIGPAMAVALLTTLYGALIANVIATPIAEKLRALHRDEMIYCEAATLGLRAIARGESPLLIGDTINAFLRRDVQAPPTLST